MVFLENVANLIKHDNGHTFDVIHSELAIRGYYIRYIAADACNYGIPQHRTRTYIVAFSDKATCDKFSFPEEVPLQKHIFDIIDKNRKVDDKYYFQLNSHKYERLNKTITDDNQIYRFSDWGIQSSKNGICFTLKANMGTYPDRVPIIRDNFGIRKITSQECLNLQGFSNELVFPATITEKSAYKPIGNSVCVPLIRRIAENIKFLKYSY